MKKYKFNIEEVLNKEVTVEAESFEKAMKKINNLHSLNSRRAGPLELPCRGATFLPFLKYDTWRLVFA